MKISIHQPAYIPWLGYFHKIINSDLFIYLDNDQFTKGSFQNRNYIRNKNEKILLTVPVLSKKKNDFINIKNLEINNKINWQKKHFSSIKLSYSKTKNFEDLIKKLEIFYINKYSHLNTYCWDMLIFFLKELEIKTKIVRYSEIKQFNTYKSELILDICKYFGAKTYISGIKGFDYLNLEKFSQNNIIVERQNFYHPTYNQVHKGFKNNLGVIDFMFNENKSLASLL
tara:strand:+ start:9820 stop:10500 length:681 start_codon:yes stop_codon:yes gene_type:complete